MGTIRHPEGYCEETCTDDERKKLAEEWVRKHVTALLTPRARDPLTGLPLADYSGEIIQTAEDETSYDWHPPMEYFPDPVDPRRDSFVDDLSHNDFNVSENMEFTSIATQRAYTMSIRKQYSSLLLYMLQIQSSLVENSYMPILLQGGKG